MHYPDRWVLLKILDEKPFYKVFAGWYGGYLHGSYWQVNSGITSVTEDLTSYIFEGVSGSKYSCPKDNYGVTGWHGTILDGLLKDDKIELVKESQLKEVIEGINNGTYSAK